MLTVLILNVINNGPIYYIDLISIDYNIISEEKFIDFTYVFSKFFDKILCIIELLSLLRSLDLIVLSINLIAVVATYHIETKRMSK